MLHARLHPPAWRFDSLQITFQRQAPVQETVGQQPVIWTHNLTTPSTAHFAQQRQVQTSRRMFLLSPCTPRMTPTAPSNTRSNAVLSLTLPRPCTELFLTSTNVCGVHSHQCQFPCPSLSPVFSLSHTVSGSENCEKRRLASSSLIYPYIRIEQIASH